MKLPWRYLLLLLLIATPLQAADWPVIRNLKQASQEAARSNQVLVVYITSPGCPYCAALEKDLLQAAYRNGELEDIHFVELNWDEAPLVNFSGERERAADFAARYELQVTPTMLFLDSGGEELSPRISGYQSQDFYWQYFRRGIEEASGYHGQR